VQAAQKFGITLDLAKLQQDEQADQLSDLAKAQKPPAMPGAGAEAAPRPPVQ